MCKSCIWFLIINLVFSALPLYLQHFLPTKVNNSQNETRDGPNYTNNAQNHNYVNKNLINFRHVSAMEKSVHKKSDYSSENASQTE